jgi:hypothetical protein
MKYLDGCQGACGNGFRLPQGECAARCCGDCLYMDLNDENSYGDYYCGRKKRYYPAGDKICGEFEEK